MAADGSGLKRRRGTEEPKNSSTYCSTDGAARVYNRSTSNQPKSSIRQRADDCTRVIRQTSALFLCPEGGARLTDGRGGGTARHCPKDGSAGLFRKTGRRDGSPASRGMTRRSSGDGGKIDQTLPEG